MPETSTSSLRQVPRAHQITVADAMVSIPKVSDTAASARDIRALFADDHIHAALIQDANGVLVTVIERTDLRPDLDHECLAATLGTLHGRVVGSTSSLWRARQLMLSSGRRRLAVVDADGRLRGLLCLKRSRTGFCSDQDVRARLTGSAAVDFPRPEGIPCKPS